jgi:hypothetical protein
VVNTAGATVLGSRSAISLYWQIKAWRFYSPPDDTVAANVRLNQGAIGEVRFVIGWEAQQISRCRWDVVVDGKELKREDSDELMKQVANEESTVVIATNLIVAGEFNYCAFPMTDLERLSGDPVYAALAGLNLPGTDEATWTAVSVIDKYRRQLLEGSKLNIRGIWPHPAMPTRPDPPLKAVLDVLEEIEQLEDVAYAQNRSRVAQMGILTVATEFDLASPSGNFGTDLEAAINNPTIDPRRTGASPILMRGPFELMTGSLSNGARGVQWTKPVQDFDERIDDKMKFLIQRLAYGFPVAPEILLGMTATNRAVAFQIEESTYRSHIEPIARLVGRTYAKALKLIYEDENAKIEVNPDPTELLAKRHSVADAKDMYDRGLVSDKYVRHVAGVSDEWKATQEDLDRIVLLRKGQPTGPGREMDPAETAGNEPVRASGSFAPEDLDAALRGAVNMAMCQAVNRIGAFAKTRLQRQPVSPPFELDPDGVANQRLPSMLGPDRLGELGLDWRAVMTPALESLLSWWNEQLAESYSAEARMTSALMLGQMFEHQVSHTACVWPLPRVDESFTVHVLSPLMDEARMLQSAAESGGD